MYLALTLLGIILILLSIVQLWKTRLEKKLGWRIRKSGNSIQYAELSDGNWRSVEFKFDMYSKEVPRHAIIVPKEWNHFPGWARDNQQLIIQRIRLALKEPQYTIIEKE